MVDLIEEFERKLEVKLKLREMLAADAGIVEKDGHAHRIPRPCGLTIHTGLGCRFGCVYCYIYDMGFTYKPRPYHLTGLQLAYAVTTNPSIALGLNGTPMAFGSITEPFMDETTDRRIISRCLKRPVTPVDMRMEELMDEGLVLTHAAHWLRFMGLLSVVLGMWRPPRRLPRRHIQSPQEGLSYSLWLAGRLCFRL